MEKYTYEINGRKSNEILKAQTKQKKKNGRNYTRQ